MKKLISCSLLSIAISTSVATFAVADDTVKLRYGTHIPAMSPGVLEGSIPLMDQAKQLSNGAIDFAFFPGEQAGKVLQMFDLVRSGAVDIGNVTTGLLSADKLPLMGILEVPGVAESSCSAVDALFKLSEPGAPIYESDLKPNGMQVLAYMPYPPYGPAASRTEINSVDDLEGMKIRNSGGLMALAVQAVGGVPVKIPSPEVYQSLQRGTLDTVLFSYLSVKSLDLKSVADYGTTGYSWGTPGDVVLISERKLKSLSEAQQEALIQAGRNASRHWCEYVDNVEAKNIEEMRASGMSIYKWSEEDVAKLNKLMAKIPSDWAADLDARGKPGTQVLEAFRNAMTP